MRPIPRHTHNAGHEHPPTTPVPRFMTETVDCPFLNIAIEEALFQSVIHTRLPIVRIWENIQPCIYMGIGKTFSEEVYVKKCRADNIPVIRRFSGGGTVWHGPGNINFTFIFPLEVYPEYRDIAASYEQVFHIVAQALSIHTLALMGISDFCIHGKKISGNAQARRKNTLLHHGTALLDAQTDGMETYLRYPPETPTYRKQRSHRAFVTSLAKENIMCSPALFTETMRGLFPECISGTLTDAEKTVANRLVKEKYTQPAWSI